MSNTVTVASQIAEYTTVIQNVVLALCGVATVLIAFCGLTTWRKELKGKSEYTKAKEILKAVFKVRQGFMTVRGPAIYSYEYPEKMREESGHLKRENAKEQFMFIRNAGKFSLKHSKSWKNKRSMHRLNGDPNFEMS